MSNKASFILKVLFASLLLSVAIKFGGPYLAIAPTPVTALILVLSPSLTIAIAFLWRIYQQREAIADETINS